MQTWELKATIKQHNHSNPILLGWQLEYRALSSISSHGTVASLICEKPPFCVTDMVILFLFPFTTFIIFSYTVIIPMWLCILSCVLFESTRCFFFLYAYILIYID